MLGEFSIDMSNLETRKRVIVISAIGRLKIEIRAYPARAFPRNFPPVLPALHRLGFTSKTKKKMLVEIQDWLTEQKRNDQP